MAFSRCGSEARARTALTTSAGRSGSAATAKPRCIPSDTASVSFGATATMGFPAARIPYILLGTTTPSRPRFMVMTWASAAASIDGILLAGKKSRKRILPEPAAAASICGRCAPSPTNTRPTPSPARLRAAVTGVHKNKRKAPANRAYNLGVRGRKRCIRREDFGSIANDLYPGGFRTFGENARAHVFTENDNACRAAQRPSLEFFPDPRQPPGFNDRAPYGHVRVHVPYVVDVWLAFQHGHDRANDALKRRIGHRHDGVTAHKKRARNRQRDVAEIIHHSFFHIEARKVRRPRANDARSARDFRLVRPPRAPLGGIVGRPPAQHRHLVGNGKSIHRALRHLRRRGRVRRVIKIEQQNSHWNIVQICVSALGAVA